MNASQSLDIDRFRKVQTLMREGTSPGERAAARGRADSMAKSAGLTLAQAMTRAEPPKPVTSASTAVNAFDAIFNTPEARARRAEQEAKRQAKCRELLSEYGSEDAAFDPTPQETALHIACKPIVVRKPVIGGDMNTLAGWSGSPSDMPKIVRDTVTVAFPMPVTVAGLWAEYAAWEKLADDRAAFEPDWSEDIRVRSRRYVLESRLDTVPAVSLDDVRARFSWMEYLNDLGWSRDVRDDIAVLATLRADVGRIVAASESPPVQSEHRTATDRRRAVVSMLDDPATASLSDREIARRVGVSPTTVGGLRRRCRKFCDTRATR